MASAACRMLSSPQWRDGHSISASWLPCMHLVPMFLLIVTVNRFCGQVCGTVDSTRRDGRNSGSVVFWGFGRRGIKSVVFLFVRPMSSSLRIALEVLVRDFSRFAPLSWSQAKGGTTPALCPRTFCGWSWQRARGRTPNATTARGHHRRWRLGAQAHARSSWTRAKPRAPPRCPSSSPPREALPSPQRAGADCFNKTCPSRTSF